MEAQSTLLNSPKELTQSDLNFQRYLRITRFTFYEKRNIFSMFACRLCMLNAFFCVCVCESACFSRFPQTLRLFLGKFLAIRLICLTLYGSPIYPLQFSEGSKPIQYKLSEISSRNEIYFSKKNEIFASLNRSMSACSLFALATSKRYLYIPSLFSSCRPKFSSHRSNFRDLL